MVISNLHEEVIKMTKKLFIRIEYGKGTADGYEIPWEKADSLLHHFLSNPNVASVTFTVEK